MAELGRGESVALDDRRVRVLSLDVRWDAGTQTAFAERIGVAALPLVRDRLESREHVVHANQPATPDESVRLGATDGVVEIDLAGVPRTVERIVVVVFVHPRANAAKRTLDEASNVSFTARDDATGEEIARSTNLAAGLGPVSAAVIADVVRSASGWTLHSETRGYEAGLDGALQMAGSRL